jgi:hypothetical protein
LLQKSSWILNALDFDQAGANALLWWTSHFSQHHRWPVPTGKDPGEAWQAGINLKEWTISGFPSGWQTAVGQFSLDSEKKAKDDLNKNEFVQNKNRDRAETEGGAKVQPQGRSGSQPVDISPLLADSLEKLEKLLKQYPVTISSTKERVYLREAMSWVEKNPEVSKEISNLVFMTPDVFDYICMHPAKIITGDNLIHYASR